MAEQRVEVEALLERFAWWRAAQSVAVEPTPQARYLSALGQRMAQAPVAVQQVLAPKVAAALAVVERDSTPEAAALASPPNALTQPSTPGAVRSARPTPKPDSLLSPLAQLNQYIATGQPRDPGASAWSGDAPAELKSTARFRETWALISAEATVDLATFRAPSNAGPLNAHRLVLQALGLMRDLSPDYLRHCLSHVETLMWLDQAYLSLKSAAPKAATGPASTRKGAAGAKRKV